MVGQELQAEVVRLLVLLRAMLCTMLRTRRGLNTTKSNDGALHALRRLSTIASALGHQKERIPDDVSTRGDVDACSRTSRAIIIISVILMSMSTSLLFIQIYCSSS